MSEAVRSFDHHKEVMAFDIRQAKRTDLNYITNSWLEAYKGSPEMSMPGLAERDYYHYQHRIMDDIIARASKLGSLYVCHVADHPDQIKGYMVAEAFDDFPPIIHWMQIKKPYWRQGVGTALIKQFFDDFNLEPSAVVYTHSSQDMLKRKDIRTYCTHVLRFRLVFIPWLRSTLNDPDWER